MYREFTAVTTH